MIDVEKSREILSYIKLLKITEKQEEKLSLTLEHEKELQKYFPLSLFHPFYSSDMKIKYLFLFTIFLDFYIFL